MERADKCPICGGEPVVGCKCFRGDAMCANRHHWHTCTVHGRIVLAQSDHSKPGCSCPEETLRAEVEHTQAADGYRAGLLRAAEVIKVRQMWVRHGPQSDKTAGQLEELAILDILINGEAKHPPERGNTLFGKPIEFAKCDE